MGVVEKPTPDGGAFLIAPGHMGIRDLGVLSPTLQQTKGLGTRLRVMQGKVSL
jgi:hypothetical protein